MCDSQLGCSLILQLLVYGLTNGAVLALNAIGVTVVYGTVRTLNLAHGDVFALTSVLVITIINGVGVNPTWSPPMLIAALALILIAAMIFGATLNVIIEQAAFKPFRGHSRLAPLIATMGISFILYQVALIWRTLLPSWVKFDHRSVPGLPEVPFDRIPDLIPTFDIVRALGLPLNVTFRFNDLFILVMAILCALVVHLILRRTSMGRAIRATAQDTQLTQLCGINPEAAITRAFAFGGALAGAAAFIFALYYARPFGNHGAQSGLLAFTAAILGGVGSPIGAVISAMLIGVASSFSDYFLAAQWTPVLLQALLIGLMIARPTGIASEDRADDLDTKRDSIMTTLSGRTRGRRRWVWGVILLAAIFPLIVGIQWQVLVTGVGVFILLALGLNVLLGLAGILDLGYAVSFGVGAYMAAMLTNKWSGLGAVVPQPLDFIIVLLVSVSCAAIFGAIKGRLTLRLRTDYLAVVTLALGLLARQVFINMRDFTGGVGGIAALPPPTIFSLTISNAAAQYYLVFGLVIVIALASRQMIQSRTGRAWMASSEDETAAEASGVNVANHKILALTVSSAIAGVAGALYAAVFAYVSPDIVDFHISAMMLAMVILGGAGDVAGSILGTAIIAGYDRLIIPRLGDVLAFLQLGNISVGYAPDVRGASYLSFGLALYLTVLLRARKQ